VRTDDVWEEWLLFMLHGVEQTSRQTIWIIKGMRELMLDYRQHIRGTFKFHSQDLVNNLFRYPYTKIEFVQHDLNVSRLTATKYLDQLGASILSGRRWTESPSRTHVASSACRNGCLSRARFPREAVPM
jgi:Fic family protein